MNIRRTLASGVVGLAGLLSGCEGMSDQQAMGLLLGGAAPYSQDPQAGAASAFLGDALVRADAAERSRSNVQQNVYVPQAPLWHQNNSNEIESIWDYPQSDYMRPLVEKIPRGQHHDLFFFNNYIDLNGDNMIGSDEFFGIKKDFDITKENIRFIYRAKLRKGHAIIKLYREDGTFLAQTEGSLKGDICCIGRVHQNPTMANPPDVMDRLPEFGAGNYVLTATCNGNHLRRAEFTITNSPREPN